MEPLEYLRQQLEKANFIPYPWDGEDKNLAAFRSKQEFIEWYCQPPGLEGEPYRDRGFYCRELARVSMLIRPKVIVEFGTSLGIGTCLLHWLNPEAQLTTVDINTDTYMPGDIKVPVGCLAVLQGIPCKILTGNSCDYEARYSVNLCFIDGDHSYEAVWKDSIRAWNNTSVTTPYAIVWHDHNDRHPGVMQAVAKFCNMFNFNLQSLPDSDTVWIAGD